MRNRFFFIILATLIASAIGINFVHVKFFKSQRVKLIDQQIAESSNSLLASPEFSRATRKPTEVEETISNVLKGSRIGKVFILRDSNSKIIYQSFNAGLLQAELPTTPEWVTVETATEYVRVRNIAIPETQNRILQVGLVLDRNFLIWEIIDDRVINYVIAIVLTLFLASVLLTLILLSPLRLLITHLKDTTSNLSNMKDVRPLPKKLIRYGRGFWAKSDEFSALLETVQKLIDRINLNYKLTRSWTLQMAHELKTPLAILRADLEAEKRMNPAFTTYATRANQEIIRMTETISQFLEWAELENSDLQKNLYALRITSEVKTVAARFEKLSPGRLLLELNSEFSVFANPAHLEQLLMNLISNALKFSATNQPVHVIVFNHSLIVKDYGTGLPQEVLIRIGEPFNIGPYDKKDITGNGLGLAWVSTVAKQYGWVFTIRSNPNGTEAEVNFPKNVLP